MQIFDEETKQILNNFGPPKIEMQIPIETLTTDFVQFNLRGVASIF